jgi:hypothetical protein
MARKEKKYHFIYKTTNLLSGRYYIGIHSTNDLEDGYLGSGNRIRLAVRKHGKENFKREILEFCDNREELKKREVSIITLEEIAKKECMNLVIGGGGFMLNDYHYQCSKKGGNVHAERMKNDLEYREKVIEKSKINLQNHITSGNHNFKTRLGFITSDETKRKMSESSKGTGIGETNSQYGTCWITKDGLNKKIKKE